jgi:protein-disulfide isomerase
MRNFPKCFAVLLFSVSLFAQAAEKNPAPKAAATPKADTAKAAPTVGSAPEGAPTPEMAEAYFKRMFGYDTNLQVKVLSIGASAIPDMYEIATVFITPEGQQGGHWFVSKDLKHAIAGEVLPFGADPFAHDRAELAKGAFGASSGPATAKLLIVEFADLECPACKDAAPIMEKLRSDFPQARFVFQSFPLAQHPWAGRAASYLDCMARSNPDHALTFIGAIFDHQKEIENAVRKTGADGKTTVDDAAVTERMRYYVEYAGADPAKIQSCAETPATAERILRSQSLGQSVGITGTPTLFINGRRIGNPGAAQYEALKAVVAYEADEADTGK